MMAEETPSEGNETPGDATPPDGSEVLSGNTPPSGTPVDDAAPPAESPPSAPEATPGGNGPLLEVHGLKVYYPIHGGILLRKIGEVKAVDGIDFRIRRGETVGLVGESGCGKTTVGKAIIRLVPPTEGSIVFHSPDKGTVDLVPLTRGEMRPFRADIQMIFQDPYSSLNPRMTVGDIVVEPLMIHQKAMPKPEKEERVAWVLEMVGLTAEQAYRYPHEFSGGQRQRIGIARALVTKPDLVICDEPVSALDVSIQAQVINLLQDLQEEMGLTYLFIAHDLSVVEHIANRIAVMYLGEIVEIGKAREVYQDPRHPYSKALLSAVPLPDPTLRGKERIILTGDVPSPLAKPSGCAFRTRCFMAEERCKTDHPVLRDVGGREVACHFV